MGIHRVNSTALDNIQAINAITASDHQGFNGIAFTDKVAIFGYGHTASLLGLTNLINSAGVVKTDEGAVGEERRDLGAVSFGGDKAIFAYGMHANGSNVVTTKSNLVSNLGVVQDDVSGV